MDCFGGKIDEAAKVLRSIAHEAKIGMILGSQFEDLAYEIEDIDSIDCYEIPNFPEPPEGEYLSILTGNLQGKRVICANGSTSYFHKSSLEEITFCMQLLKKLGVNSLIVANSVGCINKNFNLGDLIIIKDHIDITNKHITNKKEMIDVAKSIAEMMDINLKEGIYADIAEQNTEMTDLYSLGCDVVGVPIISKIIIANACGINVLEISCIASTAENILNDKLISTPKNSKEKFSCLVKEIIAVL